MSQKQKLRPAAVGDCHRIHEIRNRPEIRRTCRNQDEIEFSSHKKWFTAALADKSIKLLVFGDAQIHGVLRFDLKDAEAEISLYIDPDRSQQGLGTVVYEQGETWLKSTFPAIKKISAEILTDNPNSQKFFAKMGFRAVGEDIWEKKI